MPAQYTAEQAGIADRVKALQSELDKEDNKAMASDRS